MEIKMPRTKPVLFFLLLVILLRGGTASADPKAALLMQQAAAATGRTHSVSAVLTTRMQQGNGKMDVKVGHVYLQKPNLAHIESALSFGSPSYAAVNSDGKRLWERTAGNAGADGNDVDLYRSVPAAADGSNIGFYFALPVAFFFNPAASLTTMFAADKVSALHYAGQMMLDGVTYDIVEQVVLQPGPYTVRLYLGPDKRLRRVETEMPTPSGVSRYEADLSQIVINQPIPAEKFVFTPMGQIAPDGTSGDQSRLPVVGALAPGFSLKTMAGKTLTLAQALQGKKAVYLDFWFCDCMVCRHEFPALQRLYASMKDQGLMVYAVNASDSAQQIRQAQAQLDLIRNVSFPFLLAGPGYQNPTIEHYGVEGFPSGVLIGPDGKVLFTSLGYDDKRGLNDLKAALVKAGLNP